MTSGTPGSVALARALHAVDDGLQFCRRDARTFPVLVARLLTALSPADKLAIAGITEERLAAALRYAERHPVTLGDGDAEPDEHLWLARVILAELECPWPPPHRHNEDGSVDGELTLSESQP